MNRGTVVAAAEWIGAMVGVVAAVWCWNHAQVASEFGPVAPGAPSFAGTAYSGSWIAVAAGLVTVAGLLVIDSVRRLRSGPAGEPAEPPSSPEDLGLADGVGPGTVEHRGAE
jgi:hypothetical protein